MNTVASLKIILVFSGWGRKSTIWWLRISGELDTWWQLLVPPSVAGWYPQENAPQRHAQAQWPCSIPHEPTSTATAGWAEEDLDWGQIAKDRCSRWCLIYLAYLERKRWAIQSPQVWKHTNKLQRRDCKSRSHQEARRQLGPWWTPRAGWSWGSWRQSRRIWLLGRCLEPQAEEDWRTGTWNPARAQWGLGYSPGAGPLKACLHYRPMHVNGIFLMAPKPFLSFLC